MLYVRIVLWFIVVYLYFCVSCFAQVPLTKDVPYEQSVNYFFANDAPIVFTVQCNMDELLTDIKEKRTWHLGQISYSDSNIKKLAPIRLKARGNFRRKRKICSFPPIKFDFPKNTNQPMFFNQLGRLKFVTHCRNKEKYVQNIMVEYLIYKWYMLFTDESYRVRLAKVTWQDTSGKKEQFTQWGFFIENTKQMAKRLKGRVINIPNVHQEKTQYKKIARLAIFQYMIGNTDWGVSSLHNIRLLICDPYKPPVAVPYDFDWSGVIDAPYAKPLPEFETHDVKERVYRGFARNMEELNALCDGFFKKKTDMYEAVSAMELLTPRKKKEVIKYLDSFFQTINNKRKIRSEFILQCRTDDL